MGFLDGKDRHSAKQLIMYYRQHVPPVAGLHLNKGGRFHAVLIGMHVCESTSTVV